MEKIITTQTKKDEAFLRKKTKEVDVAFLKNKKKSKEIKELIRNMRDIMKKANGIGLSANQIGLLHRLFVAQVPNDQGRQKFYAIFNPEIKKESSEKATAEEGCLSVPETYGPVERYYKLTLTGFDARGRKIKIKAWGLLARVFQHEVDHLDGKLFVDKAKEVHKTVSDKMTISHDK